MLDTPVRPHHLTGPRAKALAEKTADAFSFDNYRLWPSVCAMLLRRGYSEQEAEAILRSKHMRWAHDTSGVRHGQTRAKHLAQYIDQQGASWKGDVEQLVRETFGIAGAPQKIAASERFEAKLDKACTAYEQASSEHRVYRTAMAAALRAAGVEE